jgi:hypothetical protein
MISNVIIYNIQNDKDTKGRKVKSKSNSMNIKRFLSAIMKKKLFLLMLLICSVTVFGQEKTGDKYLRPSVTNIYINRGELLSMAVIEQVVANGISDKFNDNRVPRNVVSISKGETISETKLANLLQSQITKEIAKVWFPFDTEAGEYSRKVMFDRGMDAATYQDERTAGAAFRQSALLKDAGKLLINRSYIVVYDIYNIRKTTARAAKGYSADCDVYLYQLDWSDQLYAALFTEPNSHNPDYINQITFPVKHIASLAGKRNLHSAEVKEPDSWSDQEVLKHFAQEIVNKADIYLAQINKDFQVQMPIYATSPLRARIGTKEGLTVDQRYFVYEQVQTRSGTIRQKRKGTVRVRKVANNGQNNQLTTRFYQVSGRKLEQGMNLMQKPDMGLGLTVYGGATDINALLELNVGMWASKHGLGATNFPYGTKVYVKYTFPLNKMTTDLVDVDGKIEKVRSGGILGGGISKDICFARFLALTPYVGFTSMLAFEKLQPALTLSNKLRFGVEAGCNLTVALSPNISLIGNANFNSVRYSWYSQIYSAGGGIRIQF